MEKRNLLDVPEKNQSTLHFKKLTALHVNLEHLELK